MNNYASSLFIEQYSFDILIENMSLQEGAIGDFFRNLKNKSSEYITKTLLNRKKRVDLLNKKLSNNLKKQGLDVDTFKIKVKKSILKNKNHLIKALKHKDINKFALVVEDTTVDIKEIIKEYIDVRDFKLKNILYSLLLTATIIFINTMIADGLAGLLIGIGIPVATAFGLGMFLALIIFGPIVEESGKFIAIDNDFAGEFLLTFNIIEFRMYVKHLMNMGISLLVSILLRIIPILMHYNTAFVQSAFAKMGKKELGLYIAILIHGVYNFLGLLIGHIIEN